MNDEERFMRRRDAYRMLFDSEDGEIVLDDLEARFHIHGTTFTPDPHETAFREGQRSVVLWIKSTLIDFEFFKQIIEENTNERGTGN